MNCPTCLLPPDRCRCHFEFGGPPEVEFVPLTGAEQAALETLTVMRSTGHGGSCSCRPCAEARAVWRGDLDEIERLLCEQGGPGRR